MTYFEQGASAACKMFKIAEPLPARIGNRIFKELAVTALGGDPKVVRAAKALKPYYEELSGNQGDNNQFAGVDNYARGIGNLPIPQPTFQQFR